MLSSVLVAIVALLAVALLVKWLAKDWKKRAPPGPRGLPVLGYLPWIDPKSPHESLANLTKKYGPLCALQMGPIPTVLVSDPKILKNIFAQDEFTGRAPLYLTHGIMKGYGEMLEQSTKKLSTFGAL